MKITIKFFVITVFMCACLIGYSQDFWESVELPQSGNTVDALGIRNDGLLILGANDKVYYSSNYGDEWSESSNWPGYWSKCIGFNSDDDIFIGTQSNGIYRSTDDGVSFTEINNGLSFLNVWCILVLPNDNILLGTPGGIFKSTDNGDNWALFGSGLPDDEIEHLIRADNGDLYAGTFESGVYCSTDDGENWNECSNGLPDNAMVTSMLAGPENVLFAATFPEGMFRSTDYGGLWAPFNNGLPFTKYPSEYPSYSVVEMVVLLVIVYIIIYFFGCYWLCMQGDMDMNMNYNWIPLSEGLPDEITASCMASGGPENRLLIGTWNQGLYRNAIPVNVDEKTNNQYAFNIYNYPNPLKNSTTFKIIIPKTDKYKLKIYNQLGQELETVLDKKLEKGQHEISWSINNLSAGIYYYTLSSGNFKHTDKLVVE